MTKIKEKLPSWEEVSKAIEKTDAKHCQNLERNPREVKLSKELQEQFPSIFE